MPVRASVALALLLALILPGSAAGAVKTGVDRHAGMRLKLDARVLTASVVRAGDRELKAKLFGKRIDAVCSPSFFHPGRHSVVRTRLWPVGARRMSFQFSRDISARVKWCLVEHDASDIAFVSFIEREPMRFVGKGRGPSGEWWRLAGRRGLLAEPCALLRIRGWGTRPCFEEFSDRPVTLGASEFSVCGRRDVFVVGVVSRRAVIVRVVTAAGETFEAKLFEPAGGSRVRGRYFVAALPEVTPTRVESLDAEGSILARRSLEGRPPGVCES